MKRIIPILLLSALVIGLAACQPDTAKEAVGEPSGRSRSETERATNVENCAQRVAESDNSVARDTAAPSDEMATDEAVDRKPAVSESVPPKPATLNTEAVAYAMGDPDAPVIIFEYTDFQCPFCARHALETFAQIEENLVDTGKVRYVFKDLPLTSIHPQATLAAEAARCAGAQEMGQEAYVAMHNVLFERQKAWSGQAGAADLFADYAAEMGLDRDIFATCLKNHDFEDAVRADLQEAMDLGISGAPAFLINGHLVSGALPFEVFEQAVEGLIAEATGQPVSN
jgi:protein-disulfide isomerase